MTCRAHQAGRVYLALLISSALALICGGLLLDCDPILYALKQGDLLLFCLIVGLGILPRCPTQIRGTVGGSDQR